ncbi:MAG: hypothetical protein FWG98_08135 [Candidatus Cloacimonetes bacterium]|nr:hypothetical protein [Candidatus Cloacimonadota bacterium]
MRNLARTGWGGVTRRLLREDRKKEPRKDGLGGVTRRLLRGDRKKEPRKEGLGGVTRRLLRGEFKMRYLATTVVSIIHSPFKA